VIFIKAVNMFSFNGNNLVCPVYVESLRKKTLVSSFDNFSRQKTNALIIISKLWQKVVLFLLVMSLNNGIQLWMRKGILKFSNSVMLFPQRSAPSLGGGS
jgi:hypothetical protein